MGLGAWAPVLLKLTKQNVHGLCQPYLEQKVAKITISIVNCKLSTAANRQTSQIANRKLSIANRQL